MDPPKIYLFQSKSIMYKDPELTSIHRHTESTATNGTITSEKQTRNKQKHPYQMNACALGEIRKLTQEQVGETETQCPHEAHRLCGAPQKEGNSNPKLLTEE